MSLHPDDTALEAIEVTIEAVRAEEVAAFWAAALGYRLLYRREPYLVLGPTHGAGPRVLVQRIGERSGGTGAVHLDLRVRDPGREVERLQALGARVHKVVEEAGTTWTVMADPEGTPFCVCPARSSPGGAGRSA